MVIPAPGSAPLEFRNPDGQVVVYLIAADELHRLRTEVESLRERLAQAERERDHNLAHVKELLKTLHALPPTEEEMADPSLWATSADIQKIIADLESQEG